MNRFREITKRLISLMSVDGDSVDDFDLIFPSDVHARDVNRGIMKSIVRTSCIKVLKSTTRWTSTFPMPLSVVYYRTYRPFNGRK